MRALVMGSFDPITRGHMSLVEHALQIADTVYLVAMINEDKVPRYTTEQKLKMMELACDKMERVIVDSYSGMCYQYCLDKDIDVIIRGYRNDKDYLYEQEMASYNMANCGVETQLINATDDISSSMAISSDDMARRALPQTVYDYIKQLTKLR